MPALAHAPCSLSRVRRANSRTVFGRPRNRTKYSYGSLQQLKDNATGTVFWNLGDTNDSGLPESEVLGNGATITTRYTPWTNELTLHRVGTGGVVDSIADLQNQWDLNGNLHQRMDVKQSLTEVFGYDPLNRLSTSTLNSNQPVSVGYDEAGNISSKSDVGTYTYGNAAHKHAVTAAGSQPFTYDANGNMITNTGNTIGWTSYNLPSSIASGSNSAVLNYNADHQRWKQDATYAGAHEITFYIGGLMEKTTRGASPTEFRHLIWAGTTLIVMTRRSNSTSNTYYVTTDHLGSPDLILDSAAGVLAKLSFTPFGARRGSNWQGAPSTADNNVFAATTRRGFTSHEMLDAVGLIHMNGRVDNGTIGRFLSADPFKEAPGNSQAINSFSYAFNNPFAYIDPSGFDNECSDPTRAKTECENPVVPGVFPTRDPLPPAIPIPVEQPGNAQTAGVGEHAPSHGKSLCDRGKPQWLDAHLTAVTATATAFAANATGTNLPSAGSTDIGPITSARIAPSEQIASRIEWPRVARVVVVVGRAYNVYNVAAGFRSSVSDGLFALADVSVGAYLALKNPAVGIPASLAYSLHGGSQALLNDFMYVTGMCPAPAPQQ